MKTFLQGCRLIAESNSTLDSLIVTLESVWMMHGHEAR